uniref:Hydroxy-delta-5-steroid dehydrogenase, 3 beta- and steroid delta-isomerase n=1 Tax=Maylandia zebra TaxID=106582 RepID=A0A3P9AYB5_9CICH
RNTSGVLCICSPVPVGFLGQHLLRILLEKEDSLEEIRVFDKPRNIRGILSYKQNTHGSRLNYSHGDVSYSNLKQSIKKIKIACPLSYSLLYQHKRTKNVIKACVECGIECLLYTSSMEVVGPNINGDHFKRGNEDTPYTVKHSMAYPKSKSEAEKIVLDANGTKVKGGKHLYTCSLRPTGIYGEGHQLIKDFYKQGVQRGVFALFTITIIKSVTYPLVYLGNVAWMHLLAAQALRERPEKVGGEAFYCYDDSPYKSYEDFNMVLFSEFNFRKARIPTMVLWFLAMFNDLMHWLLKPIYNYTPLLNSYTLAVVSTTFTVRTDKAERHFDYRPLYSWDECLARTKKWISTFPSENSKDC